MDACHACGGGEQCPLWCLIACSTRMYMWRQGDAWDGMCIAHAWRCCIDSKCITGKQWRPAHTSLPTVCSLLCLLVDRSLQSLTGRLGKGGRTTAALQQVGAGVNALERVRHTCCRTCSFGLAALHVYVAHMPRCMLTIRSVCA